MTQMNGGPLCNAAAGLGSRHASRPDCSEIATSHLPAQRLTIFEPLAAAEALAEEGKAIFFCRENKQPTTPHGFHDAVRTSAAVRELHRLHPGPLVGVATGEASGFDVLDLDAKHIAAKEWWQVHRSDLLPTRVHRTRSGGLHLLFQHQNGLRNSTSKIARGVDTRGDGGYVIWWPATGLPVHSSAPIAPWPRRLLTLLIPKPFARPHTGPALGHTPVNENLARLVRRVAQAQEGERNCITFSAACRAGEMARTGWISANVAAMVIAEAAVRAGLERGEAERTAWSGVRTGSGGLHV